MKRDDRKLRELLLYVSAKEEMGATKLNKLLYHADFEAYLELGRPITGHPYVKLENGPAPQHLRPARASLENDDAARLVKVDVGAPKPEERIVPLRPARTDMFDEAELRIVDAVIERYRGISGQAMSDATHLNPGWRAARLGAEIPYQTALISGEVTDADRAWAKERAAAAGW